MKRSIKCRCGKIAKRLQGCNVPPPKAMELLSESMGVWEDQIPEAKAHAEACGLTGFEFKHDGQVDFADKKSRAKFAERYGFHDKDAGYSDPTPASLARQEEIENDEVDRGFAEIPADDGTRGSDGGEYDIDGAIEFDGGADYEPVIEY